MYNSRTPRAFSTLQGLHLANKGHHVSRGVHIGWIIRDNRESTMKKRKECTDVINIFLRPAERLDSALIQNECLNQS